MSLSNEEITIELGTIRLALQVKQKPGEAMTDYMKRNQASQEAIAVSALRLLGNFLQNVNDVATALNYTKGD